MPRTRAKVSNAVGATRAGRAVRNPDYEAAVRASFARQRFMHTLGASLGEIAPGRVSIELPFAKAIGQQHGYVHAGALATIADSACGYAALTLCAPDMEVLSVEFKLNLLAPATAPLFLATGEVVRSGRTLAVCRADVVGIEAESEELVATMTATIIHRPAREEA